MGRGPDTYQRVRRPRFPAYWKNRKQYKKCSKCRIDKSVLEFDSRGKGRPLCSWCKSCRRLKSNLWHDRRKRHCHERDRKNWMKHKYGITIDQYDRMLRRQKGRCRVCKESFAKTGRKPHIDHDHATEKIRGLLCHLCNHMLGSARDKIRILRAGIRYLRGTKNA